MTCQEARDLFSARLDEALAPDDAARLEAHLAGCAECQTEWSRFQLAVSLVRSLEPARAPVGFLDRVLEAARPVPWPLRLARQVFMPIRVKLPLEAAALLLVGGLAVMTFQHSPEMQRVARQETEPRAAQAPAQPSAPAPAQPTPPLAAQGALSPAPTPPSSEARARSDAPLEDRAERLQAARPSPTEPQAPTAMQPAPTPQAGPTSEPAQAPPPAAIAQAAPLPPTTAAAPPPSVVGEAQRDVAGPARRETAAKSAAAPSAVVPLAARARPPAPPDVSGRLTVTDRTAALSALADVLRRHGGSELARRTEAGAEIIDVVIPRDAYDTFMRDVSRLGGFSAERQTPDLPAAVRVSIRIE